MGPSCTKIAQVVHAFFQLFFECSQPAFPKPLAPTVEESLTVRGAFFVPKKKMLRSGAGCGLLVTFAVASRMRFYDLPTSRKGRHRAKGRSERSVRKPQEATLGFSILTRRAYPGHRVSRPHGLKLPRDTCIAWRRGAQCKNAATVQVPRPKGAGIEPEPTPQPACRVTEHSRCDIGSSELLEA